MTKELKTAKTISPTIDNLNSETYKQVTGSDHALVQDQVIMNVSGVQPASKVNEDSLNWAIQQLSDFNPQCPIESMLSQQMIAVNSMAMSCSKRALLDDQTVEMYEMNMRHAAKLMNTFANLVSAMNKHRTQKTTIVKNQQVNVNDGGQAIVGDVTQTN